MALNNLSKDLRCLIIDLDDTLYPHESGAWLMIRDRITQYLLEVMQFPEDEVDTLRNRLWSQYGTTLRGLQTEYAVDMEHYLAYVHDSPLENVISRDESLSSMLADLPWRKVIFTNGDGGHTEKVTKLLGIRHHFEQIVDIHAVKPHCKPEKSAFEIALSIFNEDPAHCLMVDDTPANLDTAKSLGIRTVSVGERVHEGSPHIDTIHGLSGLLLG